MSINAWFRGLLVSGVIAAGVGCASKSNLPVYQSGQVGTPIVSQRGQILSVRDVVIQAPSQSAGSTGMGARIGAAAGRSAISGGAAGAVIGVVGAVVGEAAGAVVGASADNKRGEEITVLVDGGQVITIVQERDGLPLAQGERVLLVTGGSSSVYGGSGSTKVVRDEPQLVSDAEPVRRR